MTSVQSFFETIETHYKNKQPFVMYRRPGDSVVKSWLQSDINCYKTDTFSESGFVFSPFDLNRSSILFPKQHSIYIETKVDTFAILEGISIIDTEYHFKTSKINHIKSVSKAISDINNGNFKKVVLSRIEPLIYKTTFNPILAFKRLFNRYKNAMVYCWYHPKIGLWLGATPELLLSIEAQQFTTVALAGTKAYNPKKPPVWTTKEKIEQQIVTDYIAKQLKPYTECLKISEVESLRAGQLWHLKTHLTSRLKPNLKLFQLIKTLHPTPAVCGFPKDKAMDFIQKHEGYDRAYYTGFLGELNLPLSKKRMLNSRNIDHKTYNTTTTQSNFYVNLRCMQIANDTISIYVGGGITKASNAEQEWEETCKKTQTMKAILYANN